MEAIENEFLYVSSDGTKKDVRQLDYQYLVNALAKAYRNMNETKEKDEFIKNSCNVTCLSQELLERNKKYFNEVFKEEI